MTIQADEIPRLLRQLCDQRFYGSLEIKFEAGQVVLIRKTESLKLENLQVNFRTSRGGQHDRQSR